MLDSVTNLCNIKKKIVDNINQILKVLHENAIVVMRRG